MKVMERCLAKWVKDLYQQHMPVCLALIHEKVNSLHEALKELEEQNANKVMPFGVSRGWFHHFQKQYDFINVKIHGEAA
jgi:diketogulonate reductase-like aldo/keto reductase